jgi:riboflavin synthase
MFTGLVEDVGTVARCERRSDALTLVVRPGRLPVAELREGESVCHDGICLTVTALGKSEYSVLAGAETLARTTLGGARVGTRLNLERALRVGDRLGGHLVSGHVDGVGTIAARMDRGANLVLRVTAPAGLLSGIVEKGSITVDGISLTVNAVVGDTFEVALIPHTREHTTLGERQVAAAVNLETDLIGKHVGRWMMAHRKDTP